MADTHRFTPEDLNRAHRLVATITVRAASVESRSAIAETIAEALAQERVRARGDLVQRLAHLKSLVRSWMRTRSAMANDAIGSVGAGMLLMAAGSLDGWMREVERAGHYCGCCPQAHQYNGFGSDGPLSFECPKGCSCHD